MSDRERRWRGVAAAIAFSLAGTIQTSAVERPEVDRLQQIGPSLLACWRAPSEVGDFEVRVRLSLKRDGMVLGQPRIVFSRFVGGTAERRAVVRSVADALAACTPVPLTPSLGAAIAGRIFTLRFAPRSRRV